MLWTIYVDYRGVNEVVIQKLGVGLGLRTNSLYWTDCARLMTDLRPEAIWSEGAGKTVTLRSFNDTIELARTTLRRIFACLLLTAYCRDPEQYLGPP